MRVEIEHPDDSPEHYNDNASLSEYTYEDYIKDFELDYLGFDGVPQYCRMRKISIKNHYGD